jgi:hypothetical protein
MYITKHSTIDICRFLSFLYREEKDKVANGQKSTFFFLLSFRIKEREYLIVPNNYPYSFFVYLKKNCE